MTTAKQRPSGVNAPISPYFGDPRSLSGRDSEPIRRPVVVSQRPSVRGWDPLSAYEANVLLSGEKTPGAKLYMVWISSVCRGFAAGTSYNSILLFFAEPPLLWMARIVPSG